MPPGLRRVFPPLVILAILAAGFTAGLIWAPGPRTMDATRAAMAERADAGRPPAVDQCLDLTLWSVCAGGLLWTLGLAVGAKLWAGRHDGVIGPGQPVDRKILIGLGLAVILAIFPRAPRLDHSFWNDEETTMQDYAHGEWRTGKDGEWKFRPSPWQDTLFYNRGGSNHVLNSVSTRLSLATAAKFQDKEERKLGKFSEASARALPFAASLATVFLLGWLLARAGWGLAGVIAALVLALHPWHIRYSVEIRGYSIMLLAMLVCLACLWQALATGRRRWWAGFAVSEAAFLIAFAGALHMALVINLMAVVYLYFAKVDKGARWHAFRSLVAWNLLAALPVLFLMLPSLPQFSHYLKESKRMIAFVPNFGWEKDFLSHWLTGLPPIGDQPGESLGLGFAAFGLPGKILLWAGPAIALLGWGRLLSDARRPVARLLTVILVAAPILAYIHHRLADHPTMPWYLLFSLFAICIGWGAALTPWSRGGPTRWVVPGLCAVLLAACWLPMVVPVARVVATVPRQPLRETAAVMAGTAPTYGKLGDQRRRLITFGTSAKRILTYAPETMVIESLEELRQAEASAQADDKELWVAFCGRNLALNKPDSPADGDLVRAIEAEGSGFVKVQQVQGMEELFSYHVFRKPSP